MKRRTLACMFTLVIIGLAIGGITLPVSAGTLFTADFEDSEVNPGRWPDSGVINTTPYSNTQPEPFSTSPGAEIDGDAFGWQNRAAGAFGGDTTIVNTVSYTGDNCAEVGNRTLRSDIPIIIEDGIYSFTFWYMIPSGNSLIFNNKIVMKDETHGYMFLISDQDITAPSHDVWHSRTFTFDTADYPDYTHMGEIIDFRFGIWMWGRTMVSGSVITGWYGYTDNWELSVSREVPATGILLDDFVGYEDSADLLLTWDDGSTNSTGSTIAMESLGQTMKFDYDNSVWPYYSETSMDFALTRDWSDGVGYMEIWLFGDSDNDDEQFYLELRDSDSTAVVVCSDLQAVSKNHKLWNVSLADFADNGIDLTDVVSMAIGCGDQGAPVAGGAGTINVDTIKLFAPGCIEGYKPAADFTGDCLTDINDLYELSDVWLLGDHVVNATSPNSSGLVAYYTFDEMTGTAANDSSSNNYHATVDVSTGWDASGHLNGCLNFDGSFGVTAPVNVFADIDQDLTVSAWLTLADACDIVDGQIPLMFGAGPATPDPNQWDTIYTDAVSDPCTDWIHVAVTKDSDIMKVYYNGLLVGQNDVAANFDTSVAGTTRIGASATNAADYHNGKMDEVRIYDYALSHEEIVYLAEAPGGNLTQPLQPVLSEIDPYVDGIINFKDYARLAKLWLTEQLWPQ